jgi:hypothetical protein
VIAASAATRQTLDGGVRHLFAGGFTAATFLRKIDNLLWGNFPSWRHQLEICAGFARIWSETGAYSGTSFSSPSLDTTPQLPALLRPSRAASFRVASSTTSSPQFNLNTTKWLKGTHTLEVIAYDAAGNAGASPVINLTK